MLFIKELAGYICDCDYEWSRMRTCIMGGP